jgi:hypothetical protein
MPVGDVADVGLEEVEVLGNLGSDLAHRQHVDLIVASAKLSLSTGRFTYLWRRACAPRSRKQ